MTDQIYKISELVGSSEKSIEDAIQSAVSRASDSLNNLRWFEVVQMRGHIDEGAVRHYQVTLKVGSPYAIDPHNRRAIRVHEMQ